MNDDLSEEEIRLYITYIQTARRVVRSGSRRKSTIRRQLLSMPPEKTRRLLGSATDRATDAEALQVPTSFREAYVQYLRTCIRTTDETAES